jgi:hypothetical protein
MRSRFVVLAAIVCAVASVVAPGSALAKDHGAKDHGALTINATPDPSLTPGQQILIYGQLNGPNAANQPIVLYHRIPPQLSFSVISITHTNSLGFYRFVRADGIVLTNRNWFVKGPGGVVSPIIHELVAANVTVAESATTTVTGMPVLFTGSVTPNHPGEPVKLQEQNSLGGNGWVTIAHWHTDGSSNFSFPHRFALPGVYTLRAVFPGDPRNIEGVSSNDLTLNVEQKQNLSFTIDSSSPVIQAGGSVQITGTLELPASNPTPEPNVEVTLYGEHADSSWQALATTVTDTNGNYSFTQSPVHNEVYRVLTTLRPKRTTAKLYEGVQDVVTIAASSPTSDLGGTVTFTGTVTPDHTGHLIYLQEMGTDGFWHNVAAGTVATGSLYSIPYTFTAMGSFQFRSRIYGGPENVGNTSSDETEVVSGLAPLGTIPPAS